MVVIAGHPFREVVLADFEFSAAPGARPRPICLVAHELASGRHHRLWEDELTRRADPPYPAGPDVLFVAYYASAEVGCHLALGWPLPAKVLDLYVEFRNLTNGQSLPCGAGLVGALAYFGLDPLDGVEKDAMRQLALRGGPWSATSSPAPSRRFRPAWRRRAGWFSRGSNSARTRSSSKHRTATGTRAAPACGTPCGASSPG